MATTSEQLRNSSEPKKRASSVQARSGGFAKTDVRYWKERVFKPTYTRGGERYQSNNWAVYIQHRGQRHKWSLETPNREAAAAIAKNIFLCLQAQGWDVTVQRYRPKMAEKKRDVTVGEFIEAVKKHCGPAKAKTIEDYAKVFRGI